MPARIGVPLVVLAVAGGWAVLIRALPFYGPDGPGPGFVPLLVDGLLAGLALLLLITGVSVREDGARPTGAGWVQAAVVVGLMAAYIAAVARLGFVLATPPYVAVAVWQCGQRSWRAVGATALGLTLAVWILLTRLFQVPLP